MEGIYKYYKILWELSIQSIKKKEESEHSRSRSSFLDLFASVNVQQELQALNLGLSVLPHWPSAGIKGGHASWVKLFLPSYQACVCSN